MRTRLMLGLTLILSMQPLLAEKPSQQLQSKLNALKTMSADFSQVVKTKRREVSRSTGTMALARPGRFRWQTKQPMAQLVVADGKHVWIYDVELEQVSVKKQDHSVGGTAALFLSGYNDTVARDFEVSMSKKNHLTQFDLLSKSDQANFQRVQLQFNGNELSDLVLYDQLGQITQVKLHDIHCNSKLPETLFQFKTPKGVDVVEQ